MGKLLIPAVATLTADKLPRHKGKQFQTVPPKKTSDGGGYFSKFTYTKGEDYVDRISYLKKQPYVLAPTVAALRAATSRVCACMCVDICDDECQPGFTEARVRYARCGQP